MRILCLGDLHHPWTDWRALKAVLAFAKRYKPHAIIQVGDLIDGLNWSRFLKHPNSPSAQQEWDAVEKSLKRFHEMFADYPMVILEGNHDRRHLMRAAEVNIPAKLVKTLQEMFPYDNWTWWTVQKPYIVDGVAYVHGDEEAGDAFQKAKGLGRSLVQGHLHGKAAIQYKVTYTNRIFGMDVGCIIDKQAIAFQYANQKLSKSWVGWATVTDGVPQLWPYSPGAKSSYPNAF